jgi:hypothetical protein
MNELLQVSVSVLMMVWHKLVSETLKSGVMMSFLAVVLLKGTPFALPFISRRALEYVALQVILYY